MDCCERINPSSMKWNGYPVICVLSGASAYGKSIRPLRITSPENMRETALWWYLDENTEERKDTTDFAEKLQIIISDIRGSFKRGIWDGSFDIRLIVTKSNLCHNY